MMMLLLLALASAPSPQKRLEAADRSCLTRMEIGDVDGARATCGTLEPAEHPIAAYWRALLESDSTRMRNLLEPSRLGRLNPPGRRLLVLAGRYQFAAGNSDKLAELVRIAKKHHPKSNELDTLEALSGKK